MIVVEGFEDIEEAIENLGPKEGQVTVICGYTQTYAIYVHEVPATHGAGKSDKFMEIPGRQLNNAKVFSKIIAEMTKKGGTMEESLLAAAYRLQRDSDSIVPVDTSALRASSYVCLESDHEEVSRSAFEKAEAIRLAEMAKRKSEKKSKGLL